MKCCECGEELDPGDVFCDNCGTPNECPPPSVCSCGATLRAGKKFCKICGKRVGGQEQSAVKPEQVPPSRLCLGKKKDGTGCGYQLPLEFEFCPGCGTPVQLLQLAQPAGGGKCSARRRDGSVCNQDLPPGHSWCSNCTSRGGDAHTSVVKAHTSVVKKQKLCSKRREDGSICGNDLPEGASICPACANMEKQAEEKHPNSLKSCSSGLGDGGDGQNETKSSAGPHHQQEVPSARATAVPQGPALHASQTNARGSSPPQSTDGEASVEGGKQEEPTTPTETQTDKLPATERRDKVTPGLAGAGQDQNGATSSGQQDGNEPAQLPGASATHEISDESAPAAPKKPTETTAKPQTQEESIPKSSAISGDSASASLKTPEGATPSTANGDDTASQEPKGADPQMSATSQENGGSTPPTVCSGKKQDGGTCGAELLLGHHLCTACSSSMKEETKNGQENRCTALTDDGSVCGATLLPKTGLSYCVTCGKKLQHSDAPKQYFAQYADSDPDAKKAVNSVQRQTPSQAGRSGGFSSILSKGSSCSDPTVQDPGTDANKIPSTDITKQTSDESADKYDNKKMSRVQENRRAKPGEESGSGKGPEEPKEGHGEESGGQDGAGKEKKELTDNNKEAKEQNAASSQNTDKSQDNENGTTARDEDGAVDYDDTDLPGANNNGADAGEGQAGLESSTDGTEQSAQNKKKKTRGGRGAGPTQENSQDMVPVVFHVIISDMPSDKSAMDPEKYSAYIRFGPAQLGGFEPKEDKHKMEYKGKTDLGYRYEAKVMMTKHLRNSNSFPYKYIVKKKKPGKNDKIKLIWEIVQRKDTGRSDQHTVNRQFTFPSEKRSFTGVWHRYDGVAYLPDSLSESALRWFKGLFGGSTYKDKVRQDAFESAKVYLPSAKDILHSLQNVSPNIDHAEAYLEKIVHIMSSLRHQILDYRLMYVDENLVEKAVFENIIYPMMAKLKELANQRKRTVVIAMFVLLLVERFGLVVSPAFVNDLCFYMLVRPDTEQKACKDLDELKAHFPQAMKDRALAVTLNSLILDSGQDVWKFGPNLSWLCCVPLLHFLQERSIPFQEPKLSPDFQTDEWWGIETCKTRKDSFKKAYSYNHLVISDEALRMLQPAFASDPLFARTLVASLDLKPLLPILLTGLIPMEVMAATLAHHILENVYLLKDTGEKIAHCVTKMVAMWKESETANRPLPEHLEKACCQAIITKNLHRHLLGKKELPPQTLLATTHLLLMILDTITVLGEKVDSQFGSSEKAQSIVKCTQEQWIGVHYPLNNWDKRACAEHLQMLGVLLEDMRDIHHVGLKQLLEKQVADTFEKELNKLSDRDKLRVYLEQENVRPTLVGILNALAFDSLDAAFESVAHLGADQLSESQIAMLISLLSNFLEKKWREHVKNESNVLPFILMWPPIVNYFQRFREAKMSKHLSHIASHNIQYALHFIDDVIEKLQTGNIQIKVLQMLMNYRQQFLDVVEATSKNIDNVAATLSLREHELAAYDSTAKHLQTLFDFCCGHLQTDDLLDLQRCIQQQQEAAPELLLSKVCDIVVPDNIQDLADYKPRANPWKLTDEVLVILPEFRYKTTSLVFHSIFAKRAKFSMTDLTFWRAFHIVWKDASQEWQAFCKAMIEGSIPVQGTEKVFGMFQSDTGDYRWHEVKEELKRIAGHGPTEWIEERISQFSCYSAIQKHVEAASVLLHVRNTYQIEGSWEDIERICHLSQQTTMPISQVDESVLGLCKRLNNITAADVACLKGFVHHRCKDFVIWLRKNMKGVKELNVFVDLAFISAGDEAWAIGRVNCFHAAATGYAPLIFTEMKSCAELLQQCELVFQNIKADPSLPEKLTSASHHLNWFQDVQKSHGSVETTSLSQVGNIIHRGVFTVGGVEDKRRDLPSVIKLLVSEETEEATPAATPEDEEDKTPPKTYAYDELLDLQSRLMLVAGQEDKGREKVVDRFIMIMDSLVRLGKTYIKLCGDGCVLFLDWTVSFLCDITKPVCCISEFANQGKLKGHRGENALPEQFIAAVASFLEECHADWLEHLYQKRSSYPELNIYTVEQLVFLQKQLIRVSSGDVSELVYPMLSLLKAECTPEDLEAALEVAMDQVDSLTKQQQEQEDNQENGAESEQVEDSSDAADMEVFIQEMMDSGFTKALALKAAKEVGCDVIAGLDWCMKHEKDAEEDEDEDSEVMSEERKPHVGERLKDWVTRDKSITDSAIGLLEKMGESQRTGTLMTLIKNLKDVWKNFLETVSFSGADFLSMEHLGIVLKCLADRDTRAFGRSLPPSFKSGIPNLILCPTNEVLNAVTYMYMFPEDSPSPLPQPDEVLLCTGETSFEQVDIFLRRAFFGSEQKVHCLAYADTLDYDVGEKTEKKMKEYTNQAVDGNYQLVVVCTTENEYRARIVAALEKYRRPAPAFSSTNTVRQYIKTRFVQKITKGGKQSASHLDSENLCVRVVKSDRSGVGKTLYKRRLADRLKRINRGERHDLAITIPLHCRVANTQDIAACLLQHTLPPSVVLPRIIHLDIPYQVQEGVDHLLYNLLVLGCVTDAHGNMWLRSPMDLYLVETIPLRDQKNQQQEKSLVHQILDVLPCLKCWSPQDSLKIMRNPSEVAGYEKHDQLFDDDEFHSDVYQRPFQYLHCLDTKQERQAFTDGADLGKKEECLAILLKYCGVQNPSWSELTHFVWFLNKQLQDFEQSVYCGMATSDDLPGFSHFVLRFLLQMSQDFATRSLKIHEESLAALEADDRDDDILQQHEMRRKWESSPHPYIFFNPDGHSMTFLGFSIEKQSGNLLDQQTRQILVQGIMNRQLFDSLIHNRVPLTENFDILPRQDRLLRLYRVLGLHDEEIFEDDEIIDPDDTYELTTDNVKKILAIYMRFRCNIPVIVMGETGCGKTRLVKFLCALQTPRDRNINTMVLVKVHGGTTGDEIMKKVRDAERIAQKNAASVKHRPIYTVLFFDEANTTEAVGVIKEVMCDGTLAGQPISLNQNLKMVAACNPYRKHSDELIQRLENAGLGYNIDADKTVDKLGHVPMRRLVYRVQPLPQSMLPLVWDFGQLDTRVEEMYIKQMVRRYVHNGQLDAMDETGMNVLCRILMESQEFMRTLKNECSFVSLRDVDRALTITSWFFQQADKSGTLFDKLDDKLQHQDTDETSMDSLSWETDDEEQEDEEVSDMTKALILSLGVCYRACLQSKADYDKHIVQHFRPPFTIGGDHIKFQRIIDCCQQVFLDNVRLEENIARNQALKDNVFMMVVCIELRIPLFLVGKPGSSKSLAKTIVSDAMQGKSSGSDLFVELKQAQMVSFQCSPLATADGILNMFKQCAQYQFNSNNMNNFVAVVVLDEVGLAEDSPKMPLKTLHPLLEEGFQGEEVPEEFRKVAFIGISNWALDPAKMNRGILVQRDVPDKVELIETAKGICATKDLVTEKNMGTLIHKLAEAYLDIFQEAKKKREFFGLRDFYSLVKMLYAFAAKTRRSPSFRQLTAAIRRNFGGLDTIDPVKCFQRLLPESLCPTKPLPDDPDCTPSGLIKAALSGDDMGGETRYLLLLTDNYGGLSILLDNLLVGRNVMPIFGSSFPKDQEYTQICRNINRIKVCMETGQTIILLNLDNLYESLYDALNQYYAMLGGERYVDLGLGTHRVKCRVQRDFRLIVVAEKQAVYDNFPIPLINRLEKHFLTLNNIMTKPQLDLSKKLEEWAKDFVSGDHAAPVTRARARNAKKEEIGDVFMGYHPDAAPAIVLKVWEMLQVNKNPRAQPQNAILEECQRMLLWCATPDAVVRARDSEFWSCVYYEEQQHDFLAQFLHCRLTQAPESMLMAQVTTHSRLLTEHERLELCQHLPGIHNITLLSLQAFDTEQQFCEQLRVFFGEETDASKLLLVQCDCGDVNQNLIKGAQYCMQEMWRTHTAKRARPSVHHVVFIIQLPRIAGACFTGFLGGNWHCLHIDELRAPDQVAPPIAQLLTQTPADLLLGVSATMDGQMNFNNSALDMQWADRPEFAHHRQDEEQTEVSPEDVHVQLGAVQPIARPGTEELYKHTMYFQKMLTTCIQAAVALVRDPDPGSPRATHRVAVLLQLMDDDAQFLDGVHRMVGSILKQREERAHMAERWLAREAAKLDTVKRAGTFRHAIQQCLENKVKPVLAGVIAYLDTNSNLDILYNAAHNEDSPVSPWVKPLWLHILQGDMKLTYKHLCSVSKNEELEEFTVNNTGARATSLACQMPFSWLVWELVENARLPALSSDGDPLEIASSAFEDSPLCRSLKTVVGGCEEHMRQMFSFYIADILYFIFPLGQHEHQLMCRCVDKALQQLHINLVQLGVGQGLVVIHQVLEQMRTRLQSILDMATSQPNAVQALMTGTGAVTQLLAAEDEMTEDVALLTLLIEELQPRPNQFGESKGCDEWVTQYSNVAPVIIRVLGDASVTNRRMTQTDPDTQAEEEEEEEENAEESQLLPFGEKCQQQLMAIRCLWTRVMTVKLFFDYMSPLRSGPAKTQEALKKVRFQLLWKLLEDDANMKRVKTLQLLDKFLKHASGNMIRGLVGEVGVCTYCEKELASMPVELPCKHQLCTSCFRDCCPGNTEGKCPECKKKVPKNFKPSGASQENREGAEQLQHYQRQVSGFLMALVSKLCFAGQEPPEPDAVRHIFGYIIHRSKGRTLLQTKLMTVHDDIIDPTPVLRSFLLRLLLRHSEQEMFNHLNTFLKNAENLEQQEQQSAGASPQSPATPTLFEFSLLIIHCIEDLQHEREAVRTEEKASITKDSAHQLSLAGQLHDVGHALQNQSIELATLYSLGRLRYTLDACAHILHDVFVACDGSPVITPDMQHLLEELHLVCQHAGNQWPKKFLVKQLCREYGLHAYVALAERAKDDPLLQWILLEETAKVQEVSDRYLTCGHQYKSVRDCLSQLKLGGDGSNMKKTLKGLHLPEDQQETLILLSLHREFTMSHLQPMPVNIRDKMMSAVRTFVDKCNVMKDKELGRHLCENQLGLAGSPLCVGPRQDLATQGLVCVLTHLRIVLRPAVKTSHLLQPLVALIFQPNTMLNALLPTMPQDNLDEIIRVIPGEKVWQCPNGHRYFIGDCGRPYFEGVCNVCGAKIGGANHFAAPQNAEDLQRADQTKRGHILGPAAQRGFEALPERQLSAVECAFTRFFTHAALYLGASIQNQAGHVSSLVEPRISPQTVVQFFWDHLQRDLQVLHRVTGHSMDDIYLILHHLCHQMSTKKTGGHAVQLSSKQERMTWEGQFANTFIAPTVQTFDRIINEGNRMIVSDKRLGESELLKVVYEVDADQTTRGDHTMQNLQTSPAMWRYRPRITVDHFFREFHLQVETRRDMKAQFPVIRLFKAESHVLRALHYVPAIMAGQKRLMMQLHRRLDRAEANTLIICEVLKRRAYPGLEQLMRNFSKAWEIVKEHLIAFRCPAPMEGLVSLPADFHNASVTINSPLAMLLPSTQGAGLCSYILLQYLLGQHNDFLDRYCAHIKQSQNSLPEVSVRAVIERHLVGYTPERDILPMVLSHSNYSLMVGQAAKLEYDFEAFQQQLQDTLLQCKARVKRDAVGHHFPVETMVYRADTTSSRLFRLVREKIKQVSLSPAERRQIVEDLRGQLPNICQSIDNLNTALSFLKTLGGNPSSSLHDFMSVALKMKHTVYSHKAKQICNLCHVQSLWILLCYQRACILAAHQQPAFDSQDLRDLTPEQGLELEKMCQEMSIERLELLLLQLFECIMLHLSEPHDQQDGTQLERNKLGDLLRNNLEYPPYSVEPVEVRSGLLTAENLAAFPESIEGRHAVTVWLICRAQLSLKRQQLN